jgi:hypothetical protein
MKKYTLKIERDEYPESPDFWGNDDVFIVYDHRQFTVDRKGFSPRDIFEHLQAGKRVYKGYYAFPLYAYIHSGVSLSMSRSGYPFNDRWDVSSTGFVLVKRTAGQWTTKQAEKVGQSIVNEWNQYLSGDVWTCTIEDEQGDAVDSLSGIYGEEYAQEEGQRMLKNAQSHCIHLHFQKLKKWILNRVPLNRRTALSY